jgi:hypothetical protein
MTYVIYLKEIFMKKQLALALGLSVLATSAFASKARLQALGEDQYGSFYVNDNRNIFLNAANVNNYKDMITFETGSTTSDIADDSASAPRPEGGVFFGHGNLVYGVQLGSESNTANSLRTWGGAAGEQNNVDLFVGGDAGVKWGANLTYGHVTETATIDNSQTMRSRFGVIAGDIEGFANINLKNEIEEADGSDFKGKLGYQVGGAYSMNAYKFFGEYRSIKAEDKTANADAETSLIRVGAGRTDRLNDKAHLFTKLEYVRTLLNLETASSGAAAATGGEDQVTTNVPLIVGLEYDATSWLALRGSVSQSLYSDVSLKNTSNKNLANTTKVNLGASLKFGEMSVDGVIGNTDDSAAPTSATGTNGSLRTDSLMSRVAVTYKW